MIEISNETQIPILDTPRYLRPRPNGKRVHISACYTWISRGVRGVRLEEIKIGGSTYTSTEALQRFGDHLAARPSVRPDAEASPPRRRQRQIERADLDGNNVELDFMTGLPNVAGIAIKPAGIALPAPPP